MEVEKEYNLFFKKKIKMMMMMIMMMKIVILKIKTLSFNFSFDTNYDCKRNFLRDNFTFKQNIC